MSKRSLMGGALGAFLCAAASPVLAADFPERGLFEGEMLCEAGWVWSHWSLKKEGERIMLLGLSRGVPEELGQEAPQSPFGEYGGPVVKRETPLEGGWTHEVLFSGPPTRLAMRMGEGENEGGIEAAWLDSSSGQPARGCAPFSLGKAPPVTEAYDAWLALAEKPDPGTEDALAFYEAELVLPSADLISVLDRDDYKRRTAEASTQFWRAWREGVQERIFTGDLSTPEAEEAYRAEIASLGAPTLRQGYYGGMGKESLLTHAYERLHQAGLLEPRPFAEALGETEEEKKAFCDSVERWAPGGLVNDFEERIGYPNLYWDRPFLESLVETAAECDKGEETVARIARYWPNIQQRQQQIRRIQADAQAVLEQPDSLKDFLAIDWRAPASGVAGLTSSDVGAYYGVTVAQDRPRRIAALISGAQELAQRKRIPEEDYLRLCQYPPRPNFSPFERIPAEYERAQDFRQRNPGHGEACAALKTAFEARRCDAIAEDSGLTEDFAGLRLQYSDGSSAQLKSFAEFACEVKVKWKLDLAFEDPADPAVAFFFPEDNNPEAGAPFRLKLGKVPGEEAIWRPTAVEVRPDVTARLDGRRFSLELFMPCLFVRNFWKGDVGLCAQ